MLPRARLISCNAEMNESRSEKFCMESGRSGRTDAETAATRARRRRASTTRIRKGRPSRTCPVRFTNQARREDQTAALARMSAKF
jgi:hypothetical protein